LQSQKILLLYINTIKQVFNWGCEEEIVPAEVAGALRTVKSLQTGRSAAVEAVLGHSNAKTTEIYAKASFEKAARVAREIG